MFSVSTAVVLLVFFVSQALGQIGTTTPATPTKLITKTSEQPSTPSEKTLGQIGTTTPATPTKLITKTSEQPSTPSEKTFVKLGVVIDKLWNDAYKNSTSENFRNLSKAFSSALRSLYKDSPNYAYVEVSKVHVTEYDGKVLAFAKLYLVLKEGVEVFIEDVFKDKVATGKLDTDLSVIKDSAEFEPLGVWFKDWKAKEGECGEKCEGAARPFSIVKECEPDAGFSCDGLKEPTEETDDCAKYCSLTGAVSVSSVILVIGILLSSSFL